MVIIKDNQRVKILPSLKKPGLIVLGLILFCGIVQAQSSTKLFIKKYQPLADSLSERYGIPASVILGVSIIESSAGTSKNCKLLNNFFGIVGKNKLMKTKGIKSRYKQYDDPHDSFKDFCKLLKKKKYYDKLKGNMDYKLWTDAISKSGYSEVPSVWKQRINDTIRKNKLASGDKKTRQKDQDQP
ncbi:MAG TPA: glucosaminidase domain-containing protein [Chitinophagaceae bacterium]|nr:glucosaminidase domain-containing protein [Chitinophagaceae bacterium]